MERIYINKVLTTFQPLQIFFQSLSRDPPYRRAFPQTKQVRLRRLKIIFN